MDWTNVEQVYDRGLTKCLTFSIVASYISPVNFPSDYAHHKDRAQSNTSAVERDVRQPPQMPSVIGEPHRY